MITVIEEPAYPKFRPIPRLHRRVVITEKVNGTNGLIEITDVTDFSTLELPAQSGFIVHKDARKYRVSAGSRNRWISPQNDNFGFAKWVWEHAYELLALGEGKHYGEWFGKGIQSGYGLDEKRFALFNVNRWYEPRFHWVVPEHLEPFPKAQPIPEVATLTVVPVLSVTEGKYLNEEVEEVLHILESSGSFIAPGFRDPEGIVVWHDAAGVYFKATLKNDEQPKSKVASK
ncbi:RNA ligase family protein [Streptomyces sp. NPDC058252]|uniref:RNA ligase family protein n=1 Tax=Streptomyces sp. NPDC058252 TaxID=3346405 RepID=UPI0036EED4B5